MQNPSPFRPFCHLRLRGRTDQTSPVVSSRQRFYFERKYFILRGAGSAEPRSPRGDFPPAEFPGTRDPFARAPPDGSSARGTTRRGKGVSEEIRIGGFPPRRSRFPPPAATWALEVGWKKAEFGGGGAEALTSWGSWRGWRCRRRCSCSGPAGRSPCCPTPRPSCTKTRRLSRRQSPA